MEKYKTKSKHFSSFEKQVLFDLLKRYKHIVEAKKSDSTTLKDKDVAWSEICHEYNASQLVTQERNVRQLKKFWANLKQNQRDALTKEKQSRMATGGGPSIASMEIDPDVAVIVPNLMKTAPAIYSSNLNEEEVKQRETQIMNCVADGNLSNIAITSLEDDDADDLESNYDDMLYNNNKYDEMLDKENITPDICKDKQVNIGKEQSSQIFAIDITPSNNNLLGIESKRTQQSREKLSSSKNRKRGIPSNDNKNEDENAMKTLRIQKLLEQEMELNTLKIEHERKILSLKEQHLIEMQKHELRAVVASAEIVELQLQLQMKKNE